MADKMSKRLGNAVRSFPSLLKTLVPDALPLATLLSPNANPWDHLNIYNEERSKPRLQPKVLWYPFKKYPITLRPVWPILDDFACFLEGIQKYREKERPELDQWIISELTISHHRSEKGL